MEKKIYKIEPVFEQRIWGTQALRTKYHYETELENIAEVYNVCAMPGHLDNVVTGTGLHLSDFYKQNRELFGIQSEIMPVEVCMAHSDSYLSIQLHPDDAYALKTEGSRGRPEGWVILEGPEKNRMVIGHHAQTQAEFEQWTKEKNWDRLFRYIEMQSGQYIHVPAGSLHAFCQGAIAVAFSTNADITYRLYDFDRIDPKTGKERELHIQQVFDNIRIPDDTLNAFWPEKTKAEGCEITRFYDEKNVYTAGRIQVAEQGFFETEAFMFYVCVNGSGRINDCEIKAGETVFVPCRFGKIEICGNLDLMTITYRE